MGMLHHLACLFLGKSYLDFLSICQKVHTFCISFLTCISVDTLCTARGQSPQMVSVHTRLHSSRQLLRQTDTVMLLSVGFLELNKTAMLDYLRFNSFAVAVSSPHYAFCYVLQLRVPSYTFHPHVTPCSEEII